MTPSENTTLLFKYNIKQVFRISKFLISFLIGVLFYTSCASKKLALEQREPCIEVIEIVKKDTVYIEKNLESYPKVSILDGQFSNSLLDSLIENSSILSQGFSGLVLYDIQEKSYLFSKNGHKYFTPASNTKILTLNACLRILGDSIPAFRYVETDNTLIIWPTGDPSLLHSYLPESQVLQFLKSKIHKKIIISEAHVRLKPYGQGWMWDDYNDSYQTEITSMPVYGNVVTFYKDKYNVLNKPHLENWQFEYSKSAKTATRKIDSNVFEIPLAQNIKKDYKQEVPYINAKETNITLLQKILNTEIFVENIKLSEDAKTLYSVPTDTLLRFMMQESDNFLAEHLLLMLGMEALDTINTQASLNFIQQNLHHTLSHKPKWVDGSGLSRYNKMTPQSMCEVLLEMYAYSPEEELFSFMAQGGGNGTLKTLFNNGSKPYIYAKSGTLTGAYNLSGYLLTQTGKKFVFSFMNNHFTHSTSLVRQEVEKILKWVHESH